MIDLAVHKRSWMFVVVSVVAALLCLASVPAQSASALEGASEQSTSGSGSEEPPTGPLDENTYSGPVLVATIAGDVLVVVDAGELMAVAARVRADVAAGTLDPSEGEAAQEVETFKAGGCRDWANAVASPFGYAASTNGCAVIGYPGYQRIYNWNNGSDVQICVQAKAFTSTAGQTWSSIGCQGNRDFSVSWGNTFAHTQVRGRSLSGATGASYIWWD